VEHILSQVRPWMAAGPWFEVLGLAGSLLLASFVYAAFPRVLGTLARRSSNELDDMVVSGIRLPLVLSLPLLALMSIAEFHLPVVKPWIGTVIVLLWGRGLAQVGGDLLAWLARHRERYHTVVTVRTLPVFDLAVRILVYGGTAYLVLVAWEVDVSGWLASAGIFGVVVGLASQETLSNLVAGVFVLADAPYKLGDTLVLDTGERGEVVDIGIRTTRLRNQDGVEIIVPNKIMAGARVQNQSGVQGGPFRIRVPVVVAYGSDLALVEELLLEVAVTTADVLHQPKPEVLLRNMSLTGLEHELCVWISSPSLHTIVVHRLLTEIVRRFQQLNLEPIPPKPPPPYRVERRAHTPS
jgi:MscS family membrane protein